MKLIPKSTETYILHIIIFPQQPALIEKLYSLRLLFSVPVMDVFPKLVQIKPVSHSYLLLVSLVFLLNFVDENCWCGNTMKFSSRWDVRPSVRLLSPQTHLQWYSRLCCCRWCWRWWWRRLWRFGVGCTPLKVKSS